MELSTKIQVTFDKLDNIDLPPILYKYRNWHDEFHKRFITKREVFMASARAFEDQLDCRNFTRFDLLTKEQIYDYFIWSSKKDNPNFTRQQHRSFARDWAKHSLVNDKEFTARFMAQSLEEYYNHDGILSLTENFKNQKMWQKYANDEKGFCIGYNTRELFRYVGGGGPVMYVDELPIIMPEPFMEFAEALRNRVYCKTKQWDFEEEYRTKKFWPNPATIEDRQIKLPKDVFNKVILGKNVTESDEKELTANIHHYIGDIEIVKL